MSKNELRQVNNSRSIEERVEFLESVNGRAGRIARIGMMIGAAIGFFGTSYLVNKYRVEEEAVSGRISELEMELSKMKRDLGVREESVSDVDFEEVEFEEEE